MIARLERELRHVSREALLRDVERIEQLAPDISEAQMYPADWLIFRVTGFRPTQTAEPAIIEARPKSRIRLRFDPRRNDDASAEPSQVSPTVGDQMPELISGIQILQDLSALSERLCMLAKLKQTELPQTTFHRVKDLQKLWNVSESTLKRLRKAGLVTRAALNPKDIAVGYVSRAVADRFAREHANLITRTRGKRRVNEKLRDRITREALRYANFFRATQETSKFSSNDVDASKSITISPLAIAKRLSTRHAISIEGVRQLLARDSRTKKIFAIAPHRSDRTRLAMLRLSRHGVPVERIAAILKSRGEQAQPALIRRDLALARASLLRIWTTQQEVPFATGTHTVDATLSPRIVREDLNEPWPSDLLALVKAWRAKRVALANEEQELARAFQALRSRALAITASLDRLQPSPVQVDEAETALRWASLLHRKLVATQGRLLLETIDIRTQAAAEQVEVRELTGLLRIGIRAIAESVMIFDPRKGGRLAGVAGLAIDRAVTRHARDHHLTHATEHMNPKRAQRVLLPGVDVAPLSQNLVPWHRWLTAPQCVLAACTPNAPTSRRAIPELSRIILTRRYSLDGQPPMTLSQLQSQLKLSRIAIVKAAAAAEHEARVVFLT